jgi:hypothetical protein
MRVASVPCDLVQSHFQGDMPHGQDQHDIIQKGAKRAQAESTQGAPETGYTSCTKLAGDPQNNQCASESPRDHQDETKWKIPCGDEKETGVLENKLLHRCSVLTEQTIRSGHTGASEHHAWAQPHLLPPFFSAVSDSTRPRPRLL